MLRLPQQYFVYGDKYPFRLEYPFDLTAFESSYALAKYGATVDMKPDKHLWWDEKLQNTGTPETNYGYWFPGKVPLRPNGRLRLVLFSRVS